MAVDLVIRPVQDGDAEQLAERMRQADLDEVAACGEPDPLKAIAFSCVLSSHAWTAVANGRVACMFGVGSVSLVTGHGSPWLLGTDDITRHAGVFIRNSPRYIRTMLSVYPTLANHVDARNKKAIRWLKSVGFKVGDPVPYGPYRMPFHPFEMKA